jgi:hypothetical protein
MDLVLDTRARGGGWAVRLAVTLDRRETNDLFLAGDKLISWPTEGMLTSGGEGPLERSSMFLSEIVARPQGLTLEYESEELARRTAQILAHQVRAALTSD